MVVAVGFPTKNRTYDPTNTATSMYTRTYTYTATALVAGVAGKDEKNGPMATDGCNDVSDVISKEKNERMKKDEL